MTAPAHPKDPAAVSLGSRTSRLKARAARINGRLGGAPSALARLVRDAEEIRIGEETYTGRRTLEALEERLQGEPPLTRVLIDGTDETWRFER